MDPSRGDRLGSWDRVFFRIALRVVPRGAGHPWPRHPGRGALFSRRVGDARARGRRGEERVRGEREGGEGGPEEKVKGEGEAKGINSGGPLINPVPV